MPSPLRGRRAGHRDLWAWCSALPLGLGSWAPLVAGLRCGVWRWVLWGLLWPVVVASSLIAGSGSRNQAALGGVGLIVAWRGCDHIDRDPSPV